MDERESEGEMKELLSALPDEGLQLASVEEQDGLLEVHVTCEIMAILLEKIRSAVDLKYFKADAWLHIFALLHMFDFNDCT